MARLQYKVSVQCLNLGNLKRNLGISRAPLKNQAHQSTSLFTSKLSHESLTWKVGAWGWKIGPFSLKVLSYFPPVGQTPPISGSGWKSGGPEDAPGSSVCPPKSEHGLQGH